MQINGKITDKNIVRIDCKLNDIPIITVFITVLKNKYL